MGAESSRSGRTSGIPSLARKNLLARWQRRQCLQHFFAVTRHDERADAIYAFTNGARWTQTEDFAKWPLDPPLSDAGIISASQIAQRMVDFVQSIGSQLHVVITSPYYRCLQTAVEICLAMGPKTRLLIDRSLGEIYGPSIMGSTEPNCTVRPIEHARAYCRSRGLTCHPKFIGTWQSWPEHLSNARKRFANRFLTYLHRSSVTRRNFMLVTHADCVAAALTLMPSQADHAVEMIEYGGLFVAKRQRHEKETKKEARRNSSSSLTSILPDTNAGEEDDADEGDSPTLLAPESECSGTWLDHPIAAKSKKALPTSLDDMNLELPQASDGWEVFTLNIKLCRKGKRGRASSFRKRVTTLVRNGRFSCERIEELLGDLSQEPLEEGGNDLDTRAGMIARSPSASQDLGDKTFTMHSIPSAISYSTFLFGASDVANMSECGSNDFGSRMGSRVPTFTDELIEDGLRSPEKKHSLRCRSPERVSDRLTSTTSRGSRGETWRSVDRLSSRGSRGETLRSHRATYKDASLEPCSEDVLASSVYTELHSSSSRPSATDDCIDPRVGSINSFTILEKVDEKLESTVAPIPPQRCAVPATTTLTTPAGRPILVIDKKLSDESKSFAGTANLGNSSLLRRRQARAIELAKETAKSNTEPTTTKLQTDVEHVLSEAAHALRTVVSEDRVTPESSKTTSSELRMGIPVW